MTSCHQIPPHHTPASRSVSIVDPIVAQRWEDVTFVHWPVDPARVDMLTPPGLTADTFDGSGWVGLILFRAVGTRLPPLPSIPYLGTFLGANVRTYVKDASGRPGVWFHSLDATRLLPAWAARTSFGFPYSWSRMSMGRSGQAIHYRYARRWPSPGWAGGALAIEAEAGDHVPTALDEFLTARWGIYSVGRTGALRLALVAHSGWPLVSARLHAASDSLVGAAGYRVSDGEPHVLHSSGVDVRIGLPRRVR